MLRALVPVVRSALDRIVSGLRHWSVRVALVFLATRALFLLGFALAQNAMGRPVHLGEMMVRWDGWWYVYLAREGYPPELNLPGRPHFGPWGFFPLWPWTIRVVDLVAPGGSVVAAALATAVYGIGFLVVARRLAERIFDSATADTVVILLATFPGSIALTLPYTEASFLFWVVLALLAARSNRWDVVAIATFLACATRATGIIVLIALAVHGIVSVLRSRDWRPWLAVASGMAAFGMVAWFAGNRTGNALIWFDAQRQWEQNLDFGTGLVVGFTRELLLSGSEYAAYAVLAVMTLIFIILVILAIPLARRLDLISMLYSVGMIGSVFAYSNVGPRPRMIFAMVPLMVLASARLHRLRRHAVPITVVAFSSLSVAIAFVTMFEPFHVTA